MDEEFCKNLKKVRILRGLTQMQLAEKLNVSPSAVGMYEQGRRDPDIKIIPKICKTLNISADELLNIQIDNLIKTMELDKIIEHVLKFIKNENVVTFKKTVLNKDKKSCVIFFLEQLIK